VWALGAHPTAAGQADVSNTGSAAAAAAGGAGPVMSCLLEVLPGSSGCPDQRQAARGWMKRLPSLRRCCQCWLHEMGTAANNSCHCHQHHRQQQQQHSWAAAGRAWPPASSSNSTSFRPLCTAAAGGAGGWRCCSLPRGAFR